MPKSATRLTRPAVSRDITREEAEFLLSKIGAMQRTLQRLTLDLDDRIAQLKERGAGERAAIEAEIESLADKLQAWAEQNREELCKDGRKTVRLATGEIGWRMDPPSVRIRNVEMTLSKLKELRLKKFIRTKEEIDKQAILAEPEAVVTIATITLVQAEKFAIKPDQSEIEPVELIRAV